MRASPSALDRFKQSRAMRNLGMINIGTIAATVEILGAIA